MNAGQNSRFHARGFDFVSFAFTGVAGLATFFILAILVVIIGNVLVNGWDQIYVERGGKPVVIDTFRAGLRQAMANG